MANYNISYRIGVNAREAMAALNDLRTLLNRVNTGFVGLGRQLNRGLGGGAGRAAQNYYRQLGTLAARQQRMDEAGAQRLHALQMRQLQNQGRAAQDAARLGREAQEQNHRRGIVQLQGITALRLRTIAAANRVELANIKAASDLAKANILENGRRERFEINRTDREARRLEAERRRAELKGIQDAAAARRAAARAAAAHDRAFRRTASAVSHGGNILREAGEGTSRAGHRASGVFHEGFREAVDYSRATGPMRLMNLDRIEGRGGVFGREVENYVRSFRSTGNSDTENMKLFVDLHSAIGDIHKVKSIYPEMAKINFTLKTFLGERYNEEEGRNFGRIMEVTGAIGRGNPAELNEWMRTIQAMNLETKGMVNSSQILGFLRHSQLNAKAITPASLMMMQPEIMGLGASRAGTQVSTLLSGLTIGNITGNSAQRLFDLGIWDEKKARQLDSQTTNINKKIFNPKTGRINARAASASMPIEFARNLLTDPTGFIDKIIEPALVRSSKGTLKRDSHGNYNAAEVQRAANSVGLPRNAIGMIVDIMSNASIRDRIRKIQDVDPVTGKTRGTGLSDISGAHRTAQQEGAGRVLMLDASFRNALLDIGNTIMPDVIMILNQIRNVLIVFNQMNPTIRHAIVSVGFWATASAIVLGPILGFLGNVALLALAVARISHAVRGGGVGLRAFLTGGGAAAGGGGAAAGAGAVAARAGLTTALARGGTITRGATTVSSANTAARGGMFAARTGVVGAALNTVGRAGGAVAGAGIAAGAVALRASAAAAGGVAAAIMWAVRGVAALSMGFLRLMGMTTPWGIALNAAILAVSTNFLGFRDLLMAGFHIVIGLGRRLADVIGITLRAAFDGISALIPGWMSSWGSQLSNFMAEVRSAAEYFGQNSGPREVATGPEYYKALHARSQAAAERAKRAGPGHARGGIVTQTGITQVHAGERITPAASAAATFGGGGGGPLISVGQMIVREEADIEKIARKLFEMMKGQSNGTGLNGGDSLVPVYLPGM